MKSGVYTITTPSGKVYVGSAVNFSRRWQTHRNRLRRSVHDNAKLQAAWDKYKGDLVFAKIIVCAPEHVLLYEQIALDGLRPELNICKFAGNTLGYRHTEETKAKFAFRTKSFGNSGKSHSDQTKARISAAKKGKPNISKRGTSLPDDVKRKISESLKGRFAGDKHPMFGTKRSPETLKKMSDSHIGKSNLSAARPVRCVSTGREFASATEAAKWVKDSGVLTASGPYISAAARGAFKSAYGYKWELL